MKHEMQHFEPLRANNPFDGSYDLEKSPEYDLSTIDRLDEGIARKLVFACAHARAQRKDAELIHDVLDKADLLHDVLDKELSRLSLKRKKVINLAYAAVRCWKALKKLRGTSDLMQDLRQRTWTACFGRDLEHAYDLPTVMRDHDILIFGETGTGKELVAQAILAGMPGEGDSPAAGESINAATLTRELANSTLFGHVKGAFTGAVQARAGHIVKANLGALFLDEIGELEPCTQVRLLRVIETNEVRPLGADIPIRVDVRYVAATHRDLLAMVAEGTFRRDLYERLAGKVIRLPPLRKRIDDIPDIGMAIVDKYLAESTMPDENSTVLRTEVNDWLNSDPVREYHWPGNVRELQNAVRTLLLGTQPDLNPNDHPAFVKESPLTKEILAGRKTLDEVQEWYASLVLDRVGAIGKATKILGKGLDWYRRQSWWSDQKL